MVDVHIGEVDATVRAAGGTTVLTPEDFERVVREVTRRLSSVSTDRHAEDASMRTSVLGSPYVDGGGAS